MKGLIHYQHSVGQNAFHLVWKPKYAKDPFKFKVVREHCEQFLREIAKIHKIEIFELEVQARPSSYVRWFATYYECV